MKPPAGQMPRKTNQPASQPQQPAKAAAPSFLLVPIIGAVVLGANLIAGLLLINASQESQVSISHLEALHINQANLEKLQQDLVLFSDKINQIQDVLLQEKDIPEFIQFVNNAAEENNSSVSLNFTSNRPSLAKNGLAVIPLSLQLTTTPKDLVAFLEDIRSEKYQLRFEHLEVDTSPVNENKISVRLSSKLYVNAQFSSPN